MNLKAIQSRINISTAMGGLIMCITLVVMLFWMLSPDLLVWWFNRRETAPLRFNMALVSFFLGWSIILLNADPLNTKAKNIRNWITTIILLFCLVSLIERVFEIDLGINELFINHKEKTGGRYTGRAPIITLLNIFAVTTTIKLINRQKFMLSMMFITLTLLVSFFLLGEALVGVSLFAMSMQSWKVSYLVGLIFTLMVLAIFLSKPLDNFRKSIYVRLSGFTLIAMLSLIVVFNAFLQNQWLQEASQQQIREQYQVIDKVQLCNSAFVDLENQWRDYFFFSDTHYLAAYRQQVIVTQKAIQNLGAIAFRDKEASATADTLLKLLNQHSSGIDDLAQLPANKDRFVIFSQKNQCINQAISLTSKIIIKKIAEEQVRFVKQNQISDQYLKIFILFGAVSIFILLAGLRMIVFNLRKRAAAELQLKTLNEQQEKHIARVTEEIKQTERRFQILIQNMQEGIQIIDYDWKYVYVNDALQKHSRQKSEDLLGYTMMEKYPGIENTDIFKLLQKCMTERVSATLENQFVYPDGSKNWFNLSIEPIQEGLFIMSTDIEERKKSDKTLNDYKMALDTSAIISITDAKGFITYVNQKFCETTGYTEQQLIGQTHRIVNSGTHDRHFFRQLWNTIQAGEVWRGEICNSNKDGSVLWLDTVIIPFMDDEHAPYQYMAIRNDITTKKNTELENEKIRLDLQRRALELQRSNAELEQYAYAASHDLQEPARTVSNFMTLLQKKYAHQLDDTAKTYIQYAVDGALRMRALILDLLEIARIGHEEKEKESVDLNEVIKQTVGELEEKIKASKASVTWDQMPTVYGHATLLHQVFVNFIGNAIKFRGKEDPVVKVTVEDKGNDWQFCVEDNGIGIEKEYYDKVFVIFQRLNKQADYAGTGIGLAVVKKVIQQHHGKIWVDSEPGKGSRFYFTLPKH